MAATAQKLSQGALTNSLVAQVTAAAAERVYCTEIIITNTGASTRTVQITAHGNATANTLFQAIPLGTGESKIIDLKVVLAATESLYLKQDAGTDVISTTYGVIEDA